MAYQKNNNGNGTPRISEWKLKELMCDIGRRIWLKGFCAGNEGNHSYRLSEDRILCTPTGISKSQLKPDDMCVVDLEGKQISGKHGRTSEILLHLFIYKNRPDVRAVIHSHPPHATAFAIAGLELPTCIHPEAEVFLGRVPMAKYVTPGDTRLGETLAPFVKDSNTVLLGNHGTVSFDKDLESAYYKLEIVDAYARILLLAKQLGYVQTLTNDEMKELLALKARFGLSDVRVKPDGNVQGLSCASDFLTRVGGEVATKGRMCVAGGMAPVRTQQPSAVEKAVAELVPENYHEQDIEQLVQVITDQIMATAQ
ncbi:MAG TPA: class II aldolase/adducin family protein [Tepidisphaeraceae bacterium]|jgi:L-fuculose-phosphate aldolase|nr:class II aldolase/adducin family protein [Tepidisphaeraceae bacterium]